MTYSDIKQRVYDVLDMPVNEIIRAGYSKKIHRIFNEATFRIAHSIVPNLREYKFSLTLDKLPAKVTMPPDFISFADEQDAYNNGKNFVITNFIDKNGIILTGKEGGANAREYKYLEDGIEKTSLKYDYTIYYNALYPEVINGGLNYRLYKFIDSVNSDGYEVVSVPTEDAQELVYEWPSLIGQLVPHYIASQLLANDDRTRSIVEMNNFETLLAAVNVDRNERQREYRSVRGWY